MPGKLMKVYLIDDDQAVVSALKLLLETVGMEAVAYTDPQGFSLPTAVAIAGMYCARYSNAFHFGFAATGATWRVGLRMAGHYHYRAW